MTESSLYIRETKIINEAKGSLLIAGSISGVKFGETVVAILIIGLCSYLSSKTE